jgi:hypothetical protein
VELVSIRLKIVQILMQDRWTVCAKQTIGSKSFWTHQMELLGDVDHVNSCFGPFGDGVSVGATQARFLHETNHRLRNCFGHTRWYS